MRCPRCSGPTTRAPRLCGICDAIAFGMTDDQVQRALDILTDGRTALAIRKRLDPSPDARRGCGPSPSPG